METYEHRGEQNTMAEAVYHALTTQTHLLVEAGTGIGKSLAYLLPGILWARDSNARIVVATYTKALQQQLVEKELPFLKQVLGDFRFALCMGGENYLCLRRFDQVRIADLYEQSEREGLQRLFVWSTRTKTGLRNDLDFEPSSGLWIKSCRQQDLCFGKECAFNKDCWYQKARAAEHQAHILIANHHLFFAHLATGGNILPSYQAVIFDEAHRIEDVATNHLGIEISNTSFRFFLDALVNQRTRKGLLTRLALQDSDILYIRGMIDNLRIAGENFFFSLQSLLKEESAIRIRKRAITPDCLSEPLLELSDALQALEVDTPEEDFEVKAFSLRAKALAAAVRVNLEQSAEDVVYWAERENSRCRLVASPIEVAQLLRENVFTKTDTVVLTSATLSSGGTFAFMKKRIGLDESDELLLDSPYNYKKQALLYIARELDELKSEGYQEKFDKELKSVLSITRGRTLVLFTSYGQLRKSSETLRKELSDLVFLCQGEMPAYRLVEQFKCVSHAILMGTASFWQGIDIPGEALQCVVIAKLPFAAPDEPVIEARMERLKNPFFEFQVPQATLLFRQGFGRLIRSKSDRGAVVVLDSRIITKRYGAWFLKSLPSCAITDERTSLKNFFENL
ncbi:MAG: helicase C-terminal domain-containing protein [Nitrospirota bacterium]